MVREKDHVSDKRVRWLAFDSASNFGLYDRGLVRPGMARCALLPLEIVHDFPTGAKRIKEPAQGIHMTIVNGEVLMEDGKHTGALPGRVLRNTYYRANHA
jgi:N-acyl-D-amino-acid deacylase